MVEDHDKASGLELRKPQGAQAVGLVWPGDQSILPMGPEGGHSRQAVVFPFNSGMSQVFAVFVFKGFPLMMRTLVLYVIGNHLPVTHSIGECTILFSPAGELRKRVAIFLDPLT